jgi:hypothetical protein
MLRALQQEAVAHRQEVSEWAITERQQPDTPFSEAEVTQFHLLLHERTRRKKEALRLYEPLPYQSDFHRSDAPERSIRAGNRAGKTLAAAVEFARAVTGQDPHGKYPRSGRAIIVGKDEKHCGEVLFRKLFRPGGFKVIRDEVTRQWRSYDPNTDEPRRKERRNAPPLIPSRFYSQGDIAWGKKREEIPRKIVLNAGTDTEWEIYFFSSLGEAPQGWDVDIVWFDEEIEHPSWYVEMAMRLVDRSEYNEEEQRWIGGKFLWSATPQAGTLRLFEIHKRAAACLGDPKPQVTEHWATIFDNRYLAEKSKMQALAKLGGNEDEIRVRIYGEFALAGMRIYGEFNQHGPHCCSSFSIPSDWCRYISIDPGRQVCAVLFLAVPKPLPSAHEHFGHVYIYDELYLKRCTAEILADHLWLKLQEHTVYEAIIDTHESRKHETASGITVDEQYRRAMEKKGIRFEATNSVTFTAGSDDVQSRILAVKSGLRIEEGRSVRWVVFRDKCPNFVWEAENYCNKKDVKHGIVTDEPLKLHDHLMDAWAMAAAHGLPYRRPKAKVRKPYAFEYLEEKKRKRRDRSGYGNSIKVG